MEAICNHQKAEGKNLFSMIKNLVSKGILPPQVLKEASSITRILGNTAAHGEDKMNQDNFDPEAPEHPAPSVTLA